MENHGEVCLEEEVDRLRRSGMSVREIAGSMGLQPAWIAEIVEMVSGEEPSGAEVNQEFPSLIPARKARSPVMRTYSKPLWLIARYRTGAMEALKIPLTTGKEALPVFSFEDEAGMFLRLGKFDGDRRIRETGAREIMSMLYPLCVGVDSVVLDPLPAPFAGLNALLSMGREAFMKFADERARYAIGSNLLA